MLTFPAKPLSPTKNDCDQLIGLFNARRYAELEISARKLIEQYPDSGIVWKILGVCLQVQGKDALPAMQQTIILMPDDAGAHSNLGGTLLNLGRVDEAVVSYRRALEIQADYAEAHFNLGIALKAKGQLEDAAACYRRALEINATYVQAHNNLGNVLRQLGQIEASLISFRAALTIKPDYIDAHNNLIYALRALHQFDEAEASCHRALLLRPDCAETHNNLGNILCALGRIDPAIASLEMVCAIDPHSFGTHAANWLVVLYYLKGDLVKCKKMLIASQQIGELNNDERLHARNYRNYIALLLPLVEQCDQREGLDTLHVIGESHSLSAHGHVVVYREQPMRCHAKWIMGCKQWHLGNDKENRFKRQFETILAELPHESTILLTIGEIDCRPDEGIVKALKKNTTTSLGDVVETTVCAYIAYLSRVNTQYQHRIIIAGVPATNAKLELLPEKTAQQLVTVIRLFNANLKKEARIAGFDFLDVYGLTDCGEGVADGQWHIDTYHLRPIAIVEALKKL